MVWRPVVEGSGQFLGDRSKNKLHSMSKSCQRPPITLFTQHTLLNIFLFRNYKPINSFNNETFRLLGCGAVYILC
jgi:hypothetical protein